MYQDFGAVVNGNQVEFKLFIPDNTVDKSQYTRGGSPQIQEIRIRGDFQQQIGGNNWDFNNAPIMVREPHPKGWLYRWRSDRSLAEGFYQYKYFVTFANQTTRWVTDPCTKYGGQDDNETSAFVIGGQKTTVKPIINRIPPQDLIIYELMIDDFTAEYRNNRAPLDGIRDKLDYLQNLGINAIEFMPWTAWPGGNFSWGYDPFQFFSVEYRYLNEPGNPADKLYKLKVLINELHERNIQVIKDGVFNHVRGGFNPNQGFGYKWLYQNPEDSPYLGTFVPLPFAFFDDFDYHNGCVQEFIRDVCFYWLDEYQVDGIRFDFSLGFFQENTPDKGITKLIADIRQHLAEQGKENVSLMVEHLTDNRYDAIDDTNKMNGDSCWFDPLFFKLTEYSRNGNIDGDTLRVLNTTLDFAPGKGAVTYIENHDHTRLINAIGGRNRWFKSQPAAIALFTSPGSVLVYNGQEFGEDYFLPGSGSERVSSRPLRWNQYSNDFVGQRLLALYKQLIAIRKQYPALRSPNFFPFLFNHPDGYGAFPNQDVIIYHRFGQAEDGQLERLIVVINFSDFDQVVNIPFSQNGQWNDVLNGGSVVVNNYRLFNQRISSNWGRIYYQK